jgi:plasmid stabilization system protein ParE
MAVIWSPAARLDLERVADWVKRNLHARKGTVPAIRHAVTMDLYRNVSRGLLLGSLCDDADRTMHCWQLDLSYGFEVRYKWDGTDLAIVRIFSQLEER